MAETDTLPLGGYVIVDAKGCIWGAGVTENDAWADWVYNVVACGYALADKCPMPHASVTGRPWAYRQHFTVERIT